MCLSMTSAWMHRGAKGQQQGLKETYGSEAVQAACLAVLEQQYPAYSQSSLREMLSMNNGSLSHALDMLANLEAETQKQRKPKAEKTPVSSIENTTMVAHLELVKGEVPKGVSSTVTESVGFAQYSRCGVGASL